jgi:glycerophosphoryl diester phosphodiesterase
MPDISRVPIMVHHMAALDGSAAPPNSLAAIRACLDAGAAVIEIDATALANEDYLLVHDDVLEMETSGRGPVSACTAAQAHGLRIRARGDVTEHPVPLLGDVARLLVEQGGSSRLQIDYKNMIPFPDDEPLRRLVRLIEPLGERVIVSSIADWQLRRLRALAPWLALGFDIQFYLDWRPTGEVPDPRMFPRQRGAYGYWDDHPIASQRIWTAAGYLRDRCGMLLGLVPGVSVFYVRHHLLAQSLGDGFNWTEMLREAGVQLDAWTLDVGDAAAVSHARQLRDAGVDQITSNTPVALATLLAR